MARSVIVASGSGTESPSGISAHRVDSYPSARRFWDEVRGAIAAEGPQRPSLVIVGAGLTGIEAAAEAAERFAGKLEVHLIDPGGDLRGWSDGARDYLRRHLADRSVRFHFGRKVVAKEASAVLLDDGSTVPADLLLWTAGLQPQQLARFGGRHAPDGRVLVEETLRDPVTRGIFWAGDVAAAPTPDTGVTFMSCQYAMQLGTTAGRNAVLELLGRPLEPFRPRPYVTCVGLGGEAGLFTEGADRKVKYAGAEGAQVKKYIVEQAIVPRREQRKAA
jgi:NADH dehydrogenase